MTKIMTLGKQAKEHYNTFKKGICPTCGQKIDQNHIDEYKNKNALMIDKIDYLEEYKEALEEDDAIKLKNILRDGKLAKEEVDGI